MQDKNSELPEIKELSFNNIPDSELKDRIDTEGAIFVQEEMSAYLGNYQFISAGKLTTILSSTPQDFIYELNNPKEDTEATINGSAFHTYLLENENFNKEFVALQRSKLPFPDKDFRTVANKDYKSQFIANAQMAGLKVVDEAFLATLEEMREALFSNKAAKNIFQDQVGIIELSIYTKIEWGNKTFYVKIRPDFISMLKPFYLDIKKTRCASPKKNKFPADAYTFGYDIKVALYFDILTQVWDKLMAFCKVEHPTPLKRSLIIAVEEEPPYKYVIYNVPEVTMELGRYRYRAALHRFAKCIETGDWPGYDVYAEENTHGIQDLILPNYAGAEIII